MSVQATTASFPTQDAAACPYCGSSRAPDRLFCGTCGHPDMPLAAGSSLRSKYIIGEVLHSGSTGALYRAADRRRRREVAIKEVLVPAGSTIQERSAFQNAFSREVRRLASLKHRNLPAIVEHFAQDGRYYLVMEYLSGPELRAFLQTTRQGFPEAQVRGYAQQLLELLSCFEAAKPPFVHGEIAPENLVLRGDGTPVLVGFGIDWRLGLRPRRAAPEAGLLAAREGVSIPGGPISEAALRDDLYSLGATLHALLTGRDFSIVSSSPIPFPPVREYAPRVSVGTAEVINRAVSTDRTLRFPSPASFRAALTPSFAVRARQAAPRRSGNAGRVVGFGIALAMVALAIVLVVYIQRTAAPGAAPPASNSLSGLPGSQHTLALADAFLAPGAYWPLAAPKVAASNGELALANSGALPLKELRAAYITGGDGFSLTGSLRLTQGPPSAYYGLVALDHPGRIWETIALEVTGNGQWALLRYHGGQVIPLSAWKHSPAIRLGHNTPNELQLLMTTSNGGKAAAFSVVINGDTVATAIPAWSAALTGRVGFIAGPGSAATADDLTVAPPGPTKVTLQDYFLNNSLRWTVLGASSPLQLNGGLLKLSATAPGTLKLAVAQGVHFPPVPTTVTNELELSLHPRPGTTGQTAGLLFAGPGAGAHAPYLAAIVNAVDSVSVVSINGSAVKVVAGPLQSNAVRASASPNTLRVRTTFTSGAQNVQVSVNGVALISYKGKFAGEQPTAGLLVQGNARADAGVLQLSSRGIQVR